MSDRDFSHLIAATSRLAEHFQNVQIFASNHDGIGGTTYYHHGSGNYFARRGQVQEWLTLEDAKVVAGCKPDNER